MILAYLYFIIPGAVANMLPALTKRINVLNYPIDNYKTWRSKRLLGDNKTWRGLIIGIPSAMLSIQIQPYFFKSIHLIDYSAYNLWWLGFLIGLGVIGGDALGSFLKRQMNIAPGHPAIPLDQLDALIGCFILLWPTGILTQQMVLTLLILVPITHILIRLAGFYLKLVDKKW